MARGKHKITGATHGRKLVAGSGLQILDWNNATDYKIDDVVTFRQRIYRALMDSKNEPPGSEMIDGISMSLSDPFPWGNSTGVHHIYFKGSVKKSGTVSVQGSFDGTGKQFNLPLTAGMDANAVAAELAHTLGNLMAYTQMGFPTTAVNGALVVDTDTGIIPAGLINLSQLHPNPAHLTALGDGTVHPYWEELGPRTLILHRNVQHYPAAGTDTSYPFDVDILPGYMLKVDTNVTLNYNDDTDYSQLHILVDGQEKVVTSTSTHPGYMHGGASAFYYSEIPGKHHLEIKLVRSQGVEVNMEVLVYAIPI